MKPGPSATRYLLLIDPDEAWTSALPKGLGPDEPAGTATAAAGPRRA